MEEVLNKYRHSDNNNTSSRCGGGHTIIFVVGYTQQSNLNAWGVMWDVGDMCTIIFILAASAINEIHIIHSLGHTTQQSNYTALCVLRAYHHLF
jgi:hypothetical protein